MCVGVSALVRAAATWGRPQHSLTGEGCAWSVCAAALNWRCRRRRSSSVARTRGACHAAHAARHMVHTCPRGTQRSMRPTAPRSTRRQNRSVRQLCPAAQARGCGGSGGGSGRDGRAIKRRCAAARRERLRAWCVPCARIAHGWRRSPSRLPPGLARDSAPLGCCRWVSHARYWPQGHFRARTHARAELTRALLQTRRGQ